MTSCAPLCVRVLLALLFLNETNRAPQVQAAGQTVFCSSRRFEQGEIITTKHNPNSPRNYCGSTVGWFFVVKQNVLFHLECQPGALSPSQATAELINLTDRATRASTFDNLMMCDVQFPEGVTTGDNAYLIAQRLVGLTVPYDRESCNAQQYIEYMVYGQVNNPYGVKSSCPVFKAFNSRSTVNAPVFRLAGRDVQYDWPVKGGALAASTAPRQRSGSFGSFQSRKSLQASQRTVVEKKGGGGGHGGGGGGHGGGGGRGGGGSRGGSEGGDNTGMGRTPYMGAANGGATAARQASSASRSSRPFWRNWSWRRSKKSG